MDRHEAIKHVEIASRIVRFRSADTPETDLTMLTDPQMQIVRAKADATHTNDRKAKYVFDDKPAEPTGSAALRTPKIILTIQSALTTGIATTFIDPKPTISFASEVLVNEFKKKKNSPEDSDETSLKYRPMNMQHVSEQHSGQKLNIIHISPSMLPCHEKVPTIPPKSAKIPPIKQKANTSCGKRICSLFPEAERKAKNLTAVMSSKIIAIIKFAMYEH